MTGFVRRVLMYKPKAKDAIWVPLARTDWSWEGVATSGNGGKTWALLDALSKGSKPKSQLPTTNFPEWSRNALETMKELPGFI
ncbi:MAG: hypothetical protein Tsb009_37880 [Planctomycetaceae bacterium]